MQETNPFARDGAHKFVLYKGLILKTFYITAWKMLAAGLYFSFKNYNKAFAAGLAATVFVIAGFDVLSNAVIPNILLRFGLYVP